MGAVGRILGLVLLAGTLVMGCGSDGDNDNGIAFRAVGFIQGELDDQGKCTVPTTDKAIADQSINIILDNPIVDSGFPAGPLFCRAFLWLENNLVRQALLVNRLDIEYEIPGARISIPSHSSSVGFRINPTDSTAANPFGPSNVYIGLPEAQLVPPSVVLFLRQNRQSLPQLPYQFIIKVTLRAQSDAGKSLVSNELRYTITWEQDLRQTPGT